MAQQEWLYGLHALTAVMSSEPERVIELWALKGRDDDRLNKVINLARKAGVSVQFVNRQALDNKVNGEQHQGVVARAKPARVLDENDLDALVSANETPLFLVLDGAQSIRSLLFLPCSLRLNSASVPLLILGGYLFQISWTDYDCSYKNSQ